MSTSLRHRDLDLCGLVRTAETSPSSAPALLFLSSTIPTQDQLETPPLPSERVLRGFEKFELNRFFLFLLSLRAQALRSQVIIRSTRDLAREIQLPARWLCWGASLPLLDDPDNASQMQRQIWPFGG